MRLSAVVAPALMVLALAAATGCSDTPAERSEREREEFLAAVKAQESAYNSGDPNAVLAGFCAEHLLRIETQQGIAAATELMRELQTRHHFALEPGQQRNDGGHDVRFVIKARNPESGTGDYSEKVVFAQEGGKWCMTVRGGSPTPSGSPEPEIAVPPTSPAGSSP